jgi:hypothetical protein
MVFPDGGGNGNSVDILLPGTDLQSVESSSYFLASGVAPQAVEQYGSRHASQEPAAQYHISVRRERTDGGKSRLYRRIKE